MNILAIETSCDETAVAVLTCSGDDASAVFTVLGNALHSQADIHAKYGGVFPALAKRAHAKNITPMLAKALEEADMLSEAPGAFDEACAPEFADILAREPELAEMLLTFLRTHRKPEIDAIAVTHGPGLEPALWVGVNFARALSKAWDIPIVPVNHMEGHFLGGVAESTDGAIVVQDVKLPILGLLISGGHTELDVMKDWLSYTTLGATRDDAVGEAFDKVARMMGLPYPGGPEISKLAERSRTTRTSDVLVFNLPRPMKDSADFDFSFSGLKTAVLYLIKNRAALTDAEKEQLACAFEDAVTDVLWTKTARALESSNARTLIIGGGVSANRHIREYFAEKVAEDYPDVALHIPAQELTTDNAVMIGIAGYYRALRKDYADSESLRASGNLSLA